MKKIMIISLSLTLLIGLNKKSFGQELEIPDDVLIQGKWQSEQDEKSFWEFNTAKGVDVKIKYLVE